MRMEQVNDESAQYLKWAEYTEKHWEDNSPHEERPEQEARSNNVAAD